MTVFWTLAATMGAQTTVSYRLQLTDKAGSHTVELSERALGRRARQGIGLDSLDVPVAQSYIDRLREAGLTIVTRSRWLNTVVVSRADGDTVPTGYWDQFPFVRNWQYAVSPAALEAAAADWALKPSRRADATSAPSKFGWADATDDAPDDFRTPILEVHGDALLDAGHRGQGMLVAVLDAGFRNISRNSFLSASVVGVRDMYIPADEWTAIYSPDADAHGALCLSTMACDTAHGVWGTAPDASYYLIRTEYAATETPLEEDMWVAGAELADSLGADLISSSLGYFTFDDPALDHTHDELPTLRAAITVAAEAAAARGIVVCNAAGNEGQTGSKWHALDFPANAPSVLAVAATRPDLAPASFTSPGFLAPWVKPDVACRGQQAYLIEPETGLPMTANGTSFATPTICGLAASLWSAAPTLTARQVVDIIRRSSLTYATPDIRLGHGMPDMAVALDMAARAVGSDRIATHRPDHAAAPSPRFVVRGSQLAIRRDGALYDLTGRRLATP